HLVGDRHLRALTHRVENRWLEREGGLADPLVAVLDGVLARRLVVDRHLEAGSLVGGGREQQLQRQDLLLAGRWRRVGAARDQDDVLLLRRRHRLAEHAVLGPVRVGGRVAAQQRPVLEGRGLRLHRRLGRRDGWRAVELAVGVEGGGEPLQRTLGG